MAMQWLQRTEIVFWMVFVWVSLAYGAVLAADGEAEAVGVPAFRLLATRRYVLDNERILTELRPEAVPCPEVQHPLFAVSDTVPRVFFEEWRVSFAAGL